MAVIGRIPGTNIFGDIERHPENEEVPGVFIYRIDAPLIFANAESFKENFSKALAQEQRPIHLAIIDLQSSPITDVTAVDMIRDLIAELDQERDNASPRKCIRAGQGCVTGSRYRGKGRKTGSHDHHISNSQWDRLIFGT